MTGEQPSSEKAGIKKMLQLTETPAQAKASSATAISSLRGFQVCYIQIFSDMDKWPSSGIYLTMTVAKARVPLPHVAEVRQQWSLVRRGRRHTAESIRLLLQQHSAS